MRILSKIFEDHAHYGSDAGHADKGSTHSYIEEYERLLAPYRAGCTFLEIGLAMGESLRMWGEYFRDSNIFGIDISIVFDRSEFKFNRKTGNTFTIIEADATKPEFLNNIAGVTFDVVMEDSTHQTQDQIDIFNLLKHRMKPGSIYLIEDLLSLDLERERYLALHENVEIIDLRHKKGRWDDALVVIKF